MSFSILLKRSLFFSALLSIGLCGLSFAQTISPRYYDSSFPIALPWIESTLQGIRDSRARPPVHARTLYYTSMAMYDVWAAFEDLNASKSFLLGKERNGYNCAFNGFRPAFGEDLAMERDKAISAAAYRTLSKLNLSYEALNQAYFLVSGLGFDLTDDSLNYSTRSAVTLGNYVAHCIGEYALNDQSRQLTDHDSAYYVPINPDLYLGGANESYGVSGNPDIIDYNRWQPIELDVFIGQSGITQETPPFLSPEWGNVIPFALTVDDQDTYSRNGNTYKVYHDQGSPPYLYTPGTTTPDSSQEIYRWGFPLVAQWSADLASNETIDISPKNNGNIDINTLPTSWSNPLFKSFYEETTSGSRPYLGSGYVNNPATNLPYQSVNVKLGDFTRVLAEFWADGPDSETPPGHWFSILNDVMSHPQFEYSFEGTHSMEPLEYQVKAYFVLAGAMHDAAIAAWSHKGWYDYIRPVSAVRALAELDQNDPLSFPITPGFSAIVTSDDPLAGENDENVGQVKILAWRGPEYLSFNSAGQGTNQAGVDWIFAKNWFPYQRPTFVTPPFAGYVSGHSTFSRAAAEVLTRLTGSAYFPGGIAEYVAEKDNFLVFEEGPSETVTLQWATYRDAADQSALSRIWGGIHPPVDDIPGRFLGEKVGIKAFELAKQIFAQEQTIREEEELCFPVKAKNGNSALICL